MVGDTNIFTRTDDETGKLVANGIYFTIKINLTGMLGTLFKMLRAAHK
jgi:hypothetical protein